MKVTVHEYKNGKQAGFTGWVEKDGKVIGFY